MPPFPPTPLLDENGCCSNRWAHSSLPFLWLFFSVPLSCLSDLCHWGRGEHSLTGCGIQSMLVARASANVQYSPLKRTRLPVLYEIPWFPDPYWGSACRCGVMLCDTGQFGTVMFGSRSFTSAFIWACDLLQTCSHSTLAYPIWLWECDLLLHIVLSLLALFQHSQHF